MKSGVGKYMLIQVSLLIPGTTLKLWLFSVNSSPHGRAQPRYSETTQREAGSPRGPEAHRAAVALCAIMVPRAVRAATPRSLSALRRTKAMIW